MEFSVTDDEVLFMYPYYSYSEKSDEMSKAVYKVFKKGWGMYNYFPRIKADLSEAIENYFRNPGIENLKIAITIMPSHSMGQYGEGLLKMAEDLSNEYGFINKSNLIQRTEEKKKSTEGGLRTVDAHLETLGLAGRIDNSVDVYIVLDDITTTGSSLEAAKQLLIENGVRGDRVVKIAMGKTMHEDDYYL